MPIIESVMGIQVIGNNGENIIKSPIVEAYIGSSLLDSTKVASDTPTDISTKVEQLMAAKHSHSNKAVLDKFAEGSDGKPTYNGIAVGGGSGGASTAANVSYTNTQLPNVKNVKTALDELVPDSHNHNNKNILDKFSDSNGKLQYNGSDISITKNGVISALGYTPEAVSAQVTTGSNITLADNTEYRLTDVTTLTLTYPTGKFECWMRLTFAASGNITVTLPADTEYLGATPNFKNSETWELSFKDKVLAAKKVGADDGGAGGENGITPHIGDNGNWYIGNTDTGKPSRGAKGDTGATGADGKTPVKGTDYWTAADKQEIIDDIHPAYYIDLAGTYPNYTCPVAMNDIKAAYNSGYNLVCRCSLGAYTATLPLFVPMPAANTWIFSGSGCLQSMNFEAQSLTVGITADGVVAEGTRLARADGTLPNPNRLQITVGNTDYIYDGNEAVSIIIDDGTEVSY